MGLPSPPVLCTDSRLPYAAPGPPTTSAVVDKHGVARAGGRGDGNVPGGNGQRPLVRPAVLLPRRRIFYSSTFVRFVCVNQRVLGWSW